MHYQDFCDLKNVRYIIWNAFLSWDSCLEFEAEFDGETVFANNLELHSSLAGIYHLSLCNTLLSRESMGAAEHFLEVFRKGTASMSRPQLVDRNAARIQTMIDLVRPYLPLNEEFYLIGHDQHTLLLSLLSETFGNISHTVSS